MMPPPLSVGAGLFTPEKWSHLTLPYVQALQHDDALGNLTNPRVLWKNKRQHGVSERDGTNRLAGGHVKVGVVAGVPKVVEQV
jgi:hypothetical protein